MFLVGNLSMDLSTDKREEFDAKAAFYAAAGTLYGGNVL